MLWHKFKARINKKVWGVMACRSKWTFNPPFPEMAGKGKYTVGL